MTTFKKTMVALDLSDMDDQILTYTRFITDIFETRQLYLTHIIPSFTSLKNLDLEFHQLFSAEYPIDEKIKDRISEQSESYFKNYQGGMDIKVEVVEGTIHKTLLHWTELKAIELLIVGKKSRTENSGITASGVARSTKSSVLFVTENTKDTIQHIVVPMDYSAYSLRALQTAIHIKTKLPNTKITCVSVLELPSNIYGMTQNIAPLTDSMRENITKTHQHFLKTHGVISEGIDLVILKDNLSNVAKVIRDYADKQQGDLIIIGAKGHTPFQNLIYGSVTERLVTYEDKIPVLVVR
jgi:nucleotide-binding universal stress UspA family protein